MHRNFHPDSLATCVPMSFAPILMYINAYFCSVADFSDYYIFGATWSVTLVSEVDDAMTEDSSVNVDSTYMKVVGYCARPSTHREDRLGALAYGFRRIR